MTDIAFEIVDVRAMEILDSRGQPTLEVQVTLDGGSRGRAGVPSGASTGEKEAHELRDEDPGRYGGRGVLKAAEAVNGEIADALAGVDVRRQRAVDDILIQLDGTDSKSRLGANAVLGASLAAAYAAAAASRTPLYRYLGGVMANVLPVPLMNVLNGGQHAANNIEVQEFMIVPAAADSFAEALRWGAEIYAALGGELSAGGYSSSVGDEGGYAPNLHSEEEALQFLCSAIRKAGLQPGRQVWLALDVAANDLRCGGAYRLRQRDVSAGELVNTYETWCGDYPIISIEDGLAEDDWSGWKLLTDRLGGRVQLVGDDLFVTSAELLRRGQREGAANAILIKPNQIGTVSETLHTMSTAARLNYSACVSHRSGETSDTFISDLAVAARCGQIKSGAPCRTDRVVKYNRLLRIEKSLDSAAEFAGLQAFMLE